VEHLEEMLKLQKAFQEKFNLHPSLHLVASAMMTEAGELWEVSGGKWWSRKKHNDEEKIEELIDILHFFLAYCVEVGISANDLFRKYSKKLSINYERQFSGY